MERVNIPIVVGMVMLSWFNIRLRFNGRNLGVNLYRLVRVRVGVRVMLSLYN